MLIIYSEFTDYGGFNVDHKKKLDRLMKTPTRFWKNKLKLSKELKKSWLNLMYELTNNALQMINSEPVNIQFIVDFILETIRSYLNFYTFNNPNKKFCIKKIQNSQCPI